MKCFKYVAVLLVLSSSWLTPDTSAAADTVSLDLLEDSMRNVRRFVLDNGMVCLVKEDRSAPVASMQIWVGTGSIHEDKYLGAGLSHYVEHMIFKGTEKRSPADITREINDAGGFINAYTTLDRTVFFTTLPGENVDVAIDVLSDAIMNATFPEDQWRQEKDVVLREFAMGYDNPGRVLGKLLRRTAYRVHPYRFPVIGYEDIFNETNRDDLHSFFKNNYVSDNMITVIVGDFDGAQVEQQLRDAFAPFKRRARAPVIVPKEPVQLAPRFARETGPYQVTRLAYSFHTVSLSHPDAAALDVLAVAVGQGRSSHLVKHLKEEKKLVHAIDASSYTPKHPGVFGIDATIDPDKEDLVRDAIAKEIQSWWEDHSFSEDDLAKAKRLLLVGELSDLQTMKGQAASLASGEFFAHDPAFSISYLKAIERVTAQDVARVARTYLVEQNQTLAILAPDSTNEVVSAVSEATPVKVVQKSTLNNGVTLLVREDHRLPFVYFCVAFNGGLLAETEENNGVTQLTADLLTRTTLTRSSAEIAETVDALGARFSHFSGKNTFGLMARCLKGDEGTILQLLTEALTQPAFSEDEIEKQKSIQVSSIRQKLEQPRWVAAKGMKEALFPNHPYRFDTEGSAESVSKLTREDVAAHFERLVVGDNTVISIFGDITMEEAKSLAEQSFAKLPAGKAPAFSVPSSSANLPTNTIVREPKQQAVLYVGYPGVDVFDERQDALSILDSTLSGLSSDLGIEVREKRGLVYYIGAQSQAGPQPGMFYFVAGAREDTVDEVRTLIDAEIQRLVTDGLRQDEFDRAKEQLISAHHISMQDSLGLAQSCTVNELIGLGFEHTFTVEERLESLTLEDVRQAAASILVSDRQAISIVLPEAKESAHNE